MNLVDFTLWLGPALLLQGVTGTIWLRRRIRNSSDLVRDVAGMAISLWLMLLVLNFSGSTRGEIGRLWIFLMPFPMLFALIPPLALLSASDHFNSDGVDDLGVGLRHCPS